MLMYVWLVVGFVLLIKGADYFVEASSSIARALRVPGIIIGLTIVAFGTSAPELAVSTTASLAGSNEIAVGNVIGSNLFNLLVVLGCCGVIRPFAVQLRWDYAASVSVAVVLFLMIFRDHFLSRPEAIFLLVLFAALTSSIALTESAVSTFQDELGWGRKKSTAIVGVVMLVLGSLSSLGYGPLAGVRILGMQLLDFFDFLTNSVMMPIAAITVCLLVSRVAGVGRIEQEILLSEPRFRRKRVFNAMIRFLCPFFAAIILISSVANAFGWISM